MGRLPSWFEKEWSIHQLRKLSYGYSEPMYIMRWLEQIGVKPNNQNWNKVFAAYPLLNADAIRGEYLASLAAEWDNDGPSRVTEWLDMVYFECAGNPKRDKLREVLEAAGGT